MKNMSKLLLAALVASVGPVLTTSGALAYVGPIKTDTSAANAVVADQNDANFTVAHGAPICFYIRGGLIHCYTPRR